MWNQWGLVDSSSSTSTMQKHKHNITQLQWTNQRHISIFPRLYTFKSILLSKTCLLCDLYCRHCAQQTTWKVQLIPVVTWRQTQIKIKNTSRAPFPTEGMQQFQKELVVQPFPTKIITGARSLRHFFKWTFSATQVLKFTSCLGQSHFQCKLLLISNWGRSTKNLFFFMEV